MILSTKKQALLEYSGLIFTILISLAVYYASSKIQIKI
jgi:hypothetical protein